MSTAKRVRRCKDCPPDVDSDARFPGPRCYPHHRERRRAVAAREHARRTANVYNLTPDQYDALYAAQGRVCAICRRATGKTKRLAVDHDHHTGTVRGLLCGNCNTILLGRWSRDSLARAVTYLDHPPATATIGTIHVNQENQP